MSDTAPASGDPGTPDAADAHDPSPVPEQMPDGAHGLAAEQAARGLQGLPEDLAARLPQLLEAMVSVGSGLQLPTTLDRIVETAAGLSGARYAAIGVLNEQRDGLADFITHGIPPDDRALIGQLPDGRSGILGALITDPVPLRLDDLAQDPRSVGFPPNHPPMRTFLGVPIRVGDEIFGNLYLTEKANGTGFSAFDQHMVKALAAEAGIQIGNARLYEATRQRERWIDGSVAVTTALLSGADPHEALVVVAEQARRLADSVAGMVLVPAEEGGLEIAAVATDDSREWLGVVVPPESPAVDQVLAGEPVFVDDASADPQMITKLSYAYGPSMLLPLQSGGRVLGALATPRLRGGRIFTRDEKALAAQFASQAALALMMAEAQRDRERLAVYEDRDRIARDLHDLVIQRLFATGMMLESAQRRSVVPEVQTGIGRAVDELDVTIQEIRTAIFALQQEPDEQPAGLRTRVLREINMAAVPLGFQPSCRFVGAVDTLVDELTGKNLIAALRETLSNAFRHAAASRIEVTVDAEAVLSQGRKGVRLTVADDGVGIPEGGRRSGLKNLKRRAEALGGDSTHGAGLDGTGATVIWEAPY